MLFKSGVDILLQQGSINLDNLILLIYIVAGLKKLLESEKLNIKIS